jgi:hypothetical protein
VIRRKCVGLPPGAAERQHQQLAQPLAQRVLVDEHLQLRHDLWNWNWN